MNREKRQFQFYEDSKVVITPDMHQAVLNIVKNTLVTVKIDPVKYLPRVEICVNEVLLNVQLHEDTTKFLIGCDIKNELLFLYFYLLGKDMDLVKIKKHIESVESNPDLPRLRGSGLYNCKKVSDRWSIDYIDEPKPYKVRMVCGFSLK